MILAANVKGSLQDSAEGLPELRCCNCASARLSWIASARASVLVLKTFIRRVRTFVPSCDLLVSETHCTGFLRQDAF